MAELVKLRTTWCGTIIVVAEIGEKAVDLEAVRSFLKR
jgi:hypothetical protein